jgi:hypothetical protein
MRDRAVNFTAILWDSIYWLRNLIGQIGLTVNQATDKLIAEKLAIFLDGHPEVMADFCNTLSPFSLQLACREAGLKSENARIATPEVTEAARCTISNKDYDRAVRLYLAQRMESSQEVCGKVAFRVMNTADVREVVEKA